MKIYKFPLLIVDTQTVVMPAGARILTVQSHGNDTSIWALVDPDAAKIERYFRIYGTGHDIPDIDTMTYIGTFQQQHGRLVWHLFECPNAKWHIRFFDWGRMEHRPFRHLGRSI